MSEGEVKDVSQKGESVKRFPITTKNAAGSSSSAGRSRVLGRRGRGRGTDIKRITIQRTIVERQIELKNGVKGIKKKPKKLKNISRRKLTISLLLSQRKPSLFTAGSINNINQQLCTYRIVYIYVILNHFLKISVSFF